MKDPALITLLSVVLSALITSAGTVIAAYISKDRKTEPQKEGLLKPKGYDDHKRDGDGGGKRDWRKAIVFLVIMGVITVFARTLLSGGPTGGPGPVTAIPSPLVTTDPCKDFVSRVYKGAKVQSTNVLNKNLNIRKLPSLSAPIITSVQNGTEFQILNGPICADGLMWWEASTTNGNTKGWIAEVTLRGTYYIEPK